MTEVIIDKNNSGQRLDKFIGRYMKNAPKSFIYKMLRKKNIVLNGKKAVGSELVKEGDTVRMYLSDETIAKFTYSTYNETFDDSNHNLLTCSNDRHSGRKNLKTVNDMVNDAPRDFDIVYEDENVLFVNKHSDLLTHRGMSHESSLNDQVRAYIYENSGSPDAHGFIASPANRLDRNTTGLVLFGKHLMAIRELTDIVAKRKINKFYLAFVAGKCDLNGDVISYLRKDKSRNLSMLTSDPAEGSRKIITSYNTINACDKASLVKAELITGKSHQLRAQLSFCGYPIIGDLKYGSRAVNHRFFDELDVERQMLHAYRISFQIINGPLSYLTGKKFLCEPPADFTKLLKHYRFSYPME